MDTKAVIPGAAVTPGIFLKIFSFLGASYILQFGDEQNTVPEAGRVLKKKKKASRANGLRF